MGAPEGARGHRAAQRPVGQVDQPYTGGPDEQRARPLRRALRHRHLAPRRVRDLPGHRRLDHVVEAEEAGHELVHRPLPHLKRRTGLGDPPVPHHHDPVGQREGLALVVRDREHGRPQLARTAPGVRRPAAPAASGPAGRAARRASAAGGGARGRGPARPAAAHRRTARRPRRRPAPGSPTSSSNSRTRTARSSFAAPCIRSPKATLPPTSRCGKSWWSWNIRPTPRLCAGTPALVPPVQQHPPAVERLEPGDHPQQRRLAAAAGPEHTHDLVLGDLQIDRVEHGPPAEPYGRVLKPEQHQNSPVRSVRRRSSTSRATAHTTIRIVERAIAWP